MMAIHSRASDSESLANLKMRCELDTLKRYANPVTHSRPANSAPAESAGAAVLTGRDDTVDSEMAGKVGAKVEAGEEIEELSDANAVAELNR
jgi:hypothetical protein